jgi:hypothetical protein
MTSGEIWTAREFTDPYIVESIWSVEQEKCTMIALYEGPINFPEITAEHASFLIAATENGAIQIYDRFGTIRIHEIIHNSSVDKIFIDSDKSMLAAITDGNLKHGY